MGGRLSCLLSLMARNIAAIWPMDLFAVPISTSPATTRSCQYERKFIASARVSEEMERPPQGPKKSQARSLLACATSFSVAPTSMPGRPAQFVQIHRAVHQSRPWRGDATQDGRDLDGAISSVAPI